MKSFIFKINLSKELISGLIKETGSLSLIKIIFFSFLGGFIDILSLFLGLELILKKNFSDFLIFGKNFTIISFLILLLIRGFLKSYANYQISISRIRFSSSLRKNIIKNAIYAPSYEISQISKGKLFSTLINDISKSSELLDRGIKAFERLIYLNIYIIAFNYVENTLVVPLFLALFSSLIIILIRPKQIWDIGKDQVIVNESIIKIFGDILNGYNDIRSNLLGTFFIDKFNNKIKLFFESFKKSIILESFYNFFKDFALAIFLTLYYLIYLNQYESEKILYVLIFSYKIANLGASSFQYARSFFFLLPSYKNLHFVQNRLSKNISDKKEYLPLYLSNLSKYDSLSWEIRNNNSIKFNIKLSINSIFLLVGKSGFGKTTLLNLFTGLLAQKNSNWILKYNNYLYNFNSYEANHFLTNNVAYSTQNPYLFEATLRENILLNKSGNLNQNQLKAMELKIFNWFKLLELEYLFDRFCNVLDLELGMIMDSFSKGEIKRIGLIRTWMMDKPIEILDEPTASLDEKVAKKVIQIILERSKSKFILISTHDRKLININKEIFRLTKRDRLEIVKFHTLEV